MRDKPKEYAYDALIAPLMNEIISVCKAHNINMAATFVLDPNPDEDDRPLCCTTVLPVDKEDEAGYRRVMECRRVMTGEG